MASPFPPKAMILAAGFGERMRPLTEHTPKPLLQAGGRSLIGWQIERLRRAGFTELVINHAHLGEQLVQALGDGASLGVNIAWSAEGHPLETAGGIAKARHLLGDAPFMVTNGDVYCEFDYGRLRPVLTAMAANPEQLAHLVLVDNPAHHPQGDFALRAGRVVEADTDRLTFSGIGCYRPALFAAILPGDKAKLAPLLTAAMAGGRVTGEYFAGRWEDVGTPSRLAALDKELNERVLNAMELNERQPI